MRWPQAEPRERAPSALWARLQIDVKSTSTPPVYPGPGQPTWHNTRSHPRSAGWNYDPVTDGTKFESMKSEGKIWFSRNWMNKYSLLSKSGGQRDATFRIYIFELRLYQSDPRGNRLPRPLWWPQASNQALRRQCTCIHSSVKELFSPGRKAASARRSPAQVRTVGAPKQWAGVNFPRVSNLHLRTSIWYSSKWIGLACLPPQVTLQASPRGKVQLWGTRGPKVMYGHWSKQETIWTPTIFGQIYHSTWIIKRIPFVFGSYCSSQPYLVHWLSSPIFPFRLDGRCPAMVTSHQISTFFNMYRHKSLVLTQFD